MSFKLNSEIKNLIEILEKVRKSESNNSNLDFIYLFGGIFHLACINNGLKYSKQEEGKSELLDIKDFSNEIKSFEFKYNFPRNSFMLESSFPKITFSCTADSQNYYIISKGLNVDKINDFEFILNIEEIKTATKDIDFTNSNLASFDIIFDILEQKILDKLVFPYGGRTKTEKNSDLKSKNNNKIFTNVENYKFETINKDLETDTYKNNSNQIPYQDFNFNFNNNDLYKVNTEKPYGSSFINNNNQFNFSNSKSGLSQTPYFKDVNSGVSGNLIGPNSEIFYGGRFIQNNSNNNMKFEPSYRYDPIGPMGFGDQTNKRIEKNLFNNPDFFNVNSLEDDENLHNIDLLPKGIGKKDNFNKKHQFDFN